MSAIEIFNGTLRFQVTRDGEPSIWLADVLELKLAAEPLERQHNLERTASFFSPTAAFLKDLAKAYEGLGLEGCTPNVAHQVWIIVSNKFVSLSSHLSTQIAGSHA
jgi:hypothetical protein